MIPPVIFLVAMSEEFSAEGANASQINPPLWKPLTKVLTCICIRVCLVLAAELVKFSDTTIDPMLSTCPMIGNCTGIPKNQRNLLYCFRAGI